MFNISFNFEKFPAVIVINKKIFIYIGLIIIFFIVDTHFPCNTHVVLWILVLENNKRAAMV